MTHRNYPYHNRAAAHAAARAAEDTRARDLAIGTSLLALAAGIAAAAMLFGFAGKAHAQSIMPTPDPGNEIESYACSPHSQALLSRVELMKVAGKQLKDRWAQQGFGIGGNEAPNDGSHVFDGARAAAAASYSGGAEASNASYGSAASSYQAPAAPQNNVYSTAVPGVSGGQQQATPPISQAMMNGDPAGVRSGLNQMVNAVDPINPSYERFFQAHPSMQEHLRLAQEMGVGPGPIVIDPNVVAQQFGLPYDDQMLDTYAFIPPDTGSVFSKVAMQIRSLFYSR
ncbi:MAG TPA: hypothetical protein DFI00_10410 [Rhodospirillaceae bacterium]|nr:hypothetical protein [Rhodospirillaceae bacterium]